MGFNSAFKGLRDVLRRTSKQFTDLKFWILNKRVKKSVLKYLISIKLFVSDCAFICCIRGDPIETEVSVLFLLVTLSGSNQRRNPLHVVLYDTWPHVDAVPSVSNSSTPSLWLCLLLRCRHPASPIIGMHKNCWRMAVDNGHKWLYSACGHPVLPRYMGDMAKTETQRRITDIRSRGTLCRR